MTGAREQTKMNSGPAKERKATDVYCFAAPKDSDGMVAVLDQRGLQMPELSGKRDEVFPLIEAAGFPLERVLYGAWIERLLKEWGRIPQKEKQT
jgi:hypothetical protein